MKKAVIIGAGPAGLTAAWYFLQYTDIKPIVVEKEEFVGGIARTAEFAGNRMDIGGHRFFSKNKEIVELWQHFLAEQGAPAYDDKVLQRETELVSGGPDPETEDRVLLKRCRLSRIRYRHKFFPYPVALGWQTISNLGFKNMAAIGCSYLYSCLHKRAENNLEDFMINRFGKTLYETFFRDYTHKVWGKSPRDIGADWGRQRIRGVSLFKAVQDFVRHQFGSRQVTETSFIEQFLYPKYGPGQLWEVMRQEIEKAGGEVRFGAEATQLLCDEKQAVRQVKVRTEDGEENISADYILSSMPISELIAALPRKAVPAMVYGAASQLPYRDFMTVGLLVDRMEVHNTSARRTLGNIVPDCWIYIQESEVKLGRLQIFNNWSPYLVRDPEHSVWLGLEYFCQQGDEYWQMADADFIDFAADEMEKIGLISKAAIIDSTLIRVPKAYPAYFGSYKDFPAVRAYLDSITNLYCIGRNGQHRYNNMDHSMLTAIEAVHAIQSENVDKSRIWRVNTEQDYQETAERQEGHGK